MRRLFIIMMKTTAEILEQKNDFVVALREHLKSRYQNDNPYTFGEGEFEAQVSEGCYSLVRRDTEKPEDISGFCFRKDLCSCSYLFHSIDDVLKEAHNFALGRENVKSRLDKGGEELEIAILGKKYHVRAYVGEGYAGEIGVDFMEAPCFG